MTPLRSVSGDVKERIMRMRGQSVRTSGARAERATDASKDAMMRALRQQVELLGDQRKHLLARIKQVEGRIEVLYGELYAKRPGDERNMSAMPVEPKSS